jgi:hypothetical protein
LSVGGSGDGAAPLLSLPLVVPVAVDVSLSGDPLWSVPLVLVPESEPVGSVPAPEEPALLLLSPLLPVDGPWLEVLAVLLALDVGWLGATPLPALVVVGALGPGVAVVGLVGPIFVVVPTVSEAAGPTPLSCSELHAEKRQTEVTSGNKRLLKTRIGMDVLCGVKDGVAAPTSVARLALSTPPLLSVQVNEAQRHKTASGRNLTPHV